MPVVCNVILCFYNKDKLTVTNELKDCFPALAKH